ncbi:ABC transporter [Acetobacterium bakii]|uniref:ABC transporter n=2 Tax=Acetobacterium bakii TaxID=52689 RepID=A0A0L6TY22_9FIRM|nr:ABC transporter [Acetobacterium bakii]
MLNFRNVVAGYGDADILSRFNAVVCQGEFVGLIGPNGAGKSTLLKCLSGLLPLKSGEIILEGKDNTTYSQRQRAQMVAVVPQSFDIDYDFSVEDIVLMGRNPYLSFKVKESQYDYDVVTEAMHATKTLQFRKRLFNTLSGGEKQRVIIARAIAQEPDIILLDEPTSALDIHHQIEIMELIRNLNLKKSMTVVAVLHDINLASRYCNRLVLMKNGSVIVDGTPEQVITEENLKKVYDMKMFIQENKLFGKPEIIPLRVIKEAEFYHSLRVHVICGGNNASQILEELEAMGHRVTAGVVNQGSDDWMVCDALGIPMIEERPFTVISNENQAKNMELMKDCDVILISDLPFGHGNVNNLKGLEDLKGTIYFHTNCLNNDFTDGTLTQYLEQIKAKKTVTEISSHEEFVEIIKALTRIDENKE